MIFFSASLSPLPYSISSFTLSFFTLSINRGAKFSLYFYIPKLILTFIFPLSASALLFLLTSLSTGVQNSELFFTIANYFFTLFYPLPKLLKTTFLLCSCYVTLSLFLIFGTAKVRLFTTFVKHQPQSFYSNKPYFTYY